MKTTLYRPVGPAELELIAASGWRRFPPRRREQPIFYPVLNETYAQQFTARWNVEQFGIGHVTRFVLPTDYLQRYPIQTVGQVGLHEELWVPAEELEVFNDHIIGLIELIATYTTHDKPTV